MIFRSDGITVPGPIGNGPEMGGKQGKAREEVIWLVFSVQYGSIVSYSEESTACLGPWDTGTQA